MKKIIESERVGYEYKVWRLTFTPTVGEPCYFEFDTKEEALKQLTKHRIAWANRRVWKKKIELLTRISWNPIFDRSSLPARKNKRLIV